MNTKYKYNICLIVFFLTCCLPHLHAVGDEARFNIIRKEYTLNSDGSTDYRYRKELTLLTHTAMNNTYGETFITYNPSYQSIHINESYTRQVDGTIVKTPGNAIIDVLPSAAANAPAFNHLKEKVVVHTGLELGATIVLDYTLHTKPGFYPIFEIKDDLQESSPIDRLHLQVNFPSGTEINCNIPGNKAKLRRTENSCTYELKKLPARSREAFQSADFGTAYRFYCSAVIPGQKEKVNLKSLLCEKPSEELCQWVKKLTEKAQTQDEQLETLQRYVNDHLANSSVKPEWTGYRPRTAQEIITSVYATELERAKLLATLCQAQGWESDVIRVFPHNTPAGSLNLAAVSAWLTGIKMDGKWKLADPQGKALNADFDRSLHYTAFRTNGDTISWKPTAHHVETNRAIKIDSKDAKEGIITYKLPMEYKGLSWRMNTLPSQRETLFELPRILNETNTYDIQTAPNIEWLPTDSIFSISNKCGSYERKIEQTRNGLRVTYSIILEKQHVQPDEYADLRDLFIEWNDSNQRTFVFQTKE